MPTQNELDAALAAAVAEAEAAIAAAQQEASRLLAAARDLQEAVERAVARMSATTEATRAAVQAVVAMEPRVPPPTGGGGGGGGGQPRPYKATDLTHDDPRDSFGCKVNSNDHAARIADLEESFGVEARWLMCFDGVEPFDPNGRNADKLARAALAKPDARYVIACRPPEIDTYRMLGTPPKRTRTPNRGPKNWDTIMADATRTANAVARCGANYAAGVRMILNSAPADQTEVRGPGHELPSDWYVFGYGLVKDTGEPLSPQQITDGRALMAASSRKSWEDSLDVFATEGGALYDDLVFRYNLAGTIGIGDDDDLWVDLVLSALPRRLPAGRRTRIRITTDDYIAEKDGHRPFVRNLRRTQMIRDRYAALGLPGLVVVEGIGLDETGGHNKTTDSAATIAGLEASYRAFGGVLLDNVRSGVLAGGVMFFESSHADRKLSTQMLDEDLRQKIAGHREVVRANGQRHISNYPVLFETLRDGIAAL